MCVFVFVSSYLVETVTNKPVITRQPSWSQIFQGEKITLTCEVQGGEKTDWWYYWWRNSEYLPEEDEKMLQFTASESLNGEYECVARRRDDSDSSTTWSEAFTVSALPQPKAQLGTNKFNMSEGSRVTLTCSVNQPAGWKYFWYRDSKTSLLNTHDTDEYRSQSEVSQEGRYWCRGGRGGRGGRGDPLYYTEYSDPISVTKIIPNKATLTLQHDRPQLYQGETIALRCAIDGGNTGWEYEWETSSLLKPANVSQYRMEALSSQHQGEYRCKGNKLRGAQSTDWSNTVTLTVIKKPRATLTSGTTTISVGGSVSLSCSVRDSDGWKYEFYRRETSTSSETRVETNVGDNGVIQVSKGGIYRCRGVRETSGYLSDMSDEVTIRITFTNKPVITRQPSWSQIFQGEKITLTCEVQGGEKTDWRYSWRRNSGYLQGDEKLQFTASESINGEYECMARHRDDFRSSTTWSE
uniref:Ig-like domain-containing protein n=1 Tax=Salarias fasciatus TaxID=181472 RepID=A0A672IK15_SALFA